MDPITDMVMALRGQPAPAPEPSAVQGALNETLLRKPEDDPYSYFKDQATNYREAMLPFAMGFLGGPRLFGGAAPKIMTPAMEEAARIQRMQDQGFTTDAYHGAKFWSHGPVPKVRVNSDAGEPGFFSTTDKGLAEDYALYPTSIERLMANPAEYMPEGAGMVPLKLNTQKYITHDAAGGHWHTANDKAIREAQEAGAQGAIIHNVIDPPAGGGYRPLTTTFISLDPSTVRSRFAQFLPENIGKNKFLGSLGGIAAMAEALRSKSQDEQ